MPGETEEPRLTTQGLNSGALRGGTRKEFRAWCYFNPSICHFLWSPMLTPTPFRLNGSALPYSAPTSRTYVSGDKASWSAPNVVLGRLRFGMKTDDTQNDKIIRCVSYNRAGYDAIVQVSNREHLCFQKSTPTRTCTVTLYIVWHANDCHPRGQKSIHKSGAHACLCTTDKITV